MQNLFYGSMDLSTRNDCICSFYIPDIKINFKRRKNEINEIKK